MQPAKLRKTREVRHLHKVGAIVAAIEHPSDVAVEDAAVAGRMRVLRGVGMEVVRPVLGGPPKDALLAARLRQKRQQKLEHTPGRVGAVRKESMIARCDRE